MNVQSAWRRTYAQKIAEEMDMQKYGVKAIYLFGSVESGNAGLCSDIDLIIRLSGKREPECSLLLWLEKWNEELCKLCEQYTSFKVAYMLDVHYVNDTDMDRKTSYATKITSVREPVELLRGIAEN